MTARIRRAIARSFLIFAAACATATEPADAVVLQKAAVVYWRAAAPASRPATIDAAAVMVRTPEWAEIERTDPARRAALEAAMQRRIAAACERAGIASGCDLVVRRGDIVDARGTPVQDLTAHVLAAL